MRHFLSIILTFLALSGTAIAQEEERLKLTPAQQVEDAILAAELMATATQVTGIIRDEEFCPYASAELCSGYHNQALGIVGDAYNNVNYLLDRFRRIDGLDQNAARHYLADRDGIRVEFQARLTTMREIITLSGNVPVTLLAPAPAPPGE